MFVSYSKMIQRSLNWVLQSSRVRYFKNTRKKFIPHYLPSQNGQLRHGSNEVPVLKVSASEKISRSSSILTNISIVKPFRFQENSVLNTGKSPQYIKYLRQSPLSDFISRQWPQSIQFMDVTKLFLAKQRQISFDKCWKVSFSEAGMAGMAHWLLVTDIID